MNANSDRKEDILREQVRLAFKDLPSMQTASLVVALVLSYAVRDTVSHASILAWILLITAIVSARMLICYRFRTQRKELFDGAYWRNAYQIWALV
ncbi:MAG TPA: hypothetical protein VK435_06955, partial [Thermodesulfovibrionales bacterium]|nr:hypothetical protein [Thermodesulfovibrionales bacterium]